MSFVRYLGLALLVAGCGGTNPLGSGGDLASTTDGGGPGPDFAVTPNDTVFTMDQFTVGAGQEVYKCQDFANPWGQDVEVREWDSHMSAGSHHLLVFYKAGATNSAAVDCSGLEFASGPYGAQTRDASIVYPDGVGAFVPAGTGLRFVSHYLNATQQPITATVQLIARRAAPGTVTQHAGIFFFNNLNIAIPPGSQPQTVTKSCTAPQDMTIMYAVGHMHQHAKSMTATLDGQTIYSLSSWDNAPFQQFMPTLQVKKGQTFTWTCTVLNDTNGYLTFGESAQTNEMCIFDGQFYPSLDNQDIGC